MSTKTTKLEFVKPDLTDSADITAYNQNWDKTDNEFQEIDEQFGIIDEHFTDVEQEIESKVKRNGDTMNGTLQVPYLVVKHPTNNSPAVAFMDSDDTTTAGGISLHHPDKNNPANRCMCVVSVNKDQNGATNKFGEYFQFPTATSNRTANGWYNVLTTKNPVSVAQGGTGATTKSVARANLEVPSITELTDGSVVVKKAKEANSAIQATYADNAEVANIALDANKATTATYATNATNDSNGKQISTTYIKGGIGFLENYSQVSHMGTIPFGIVSIIVKAHAGNRLESIIVDLPYVSHEDNDHFWITKHIKFFDNCEYDLNFSTHDYYKGGWCVSLDQKCTGSNHPDQMPTMYYKVLFNYDI